MRCPFCGGVEDKVVDSRLVSEGLSIRRRRECLSCGRRFTTYEEIENLPLMVVKKDGRREPFSRNKILQGILKACGKRPIGVERIESVVDEIVAELHGRGKEEIFSREIGKIVMEKLKRLDEIAYVRFASVYKEFKAIETFLKEIEKIRGEKYGGENKKDHREDYPSKEKGRENSSF